MRFSVSVPVLSVQITVAEPSVSTAGRWRIRALRLPCAGAHGQGQGDGGEQPFRDIGHNDANGKEKIVPKGQPQPLTQQKKEEAQQCRQARHQAAQAHDLLLQGRDGGVRRLGQMRDLAKLRMHARGKDHRLGLAGHQRGARQEDILAVEEFFCDAGVGITALGQDSPVMVAVFTRTPNASSRRHRPGCHRPLPGG